jgi:hypothetical protein
MWRLSDLLKVIKLMSGEAEIAADLGLGRRKG